MKIVATSDLHGYLPEIEPCDLLLLAGDICPVWDHSYQYQLAWLNTRFREWLDIVPARRVIGTWGNHDKLAHHAHHLIPEGLRWTELVDELVEFEGLRIFGSPWQREFNNWAFNLTNKELRRKYDLMPDCDIIVSHGPPHGFADMYLGRRLGSRTLTKRIRQIKPKLVVYGHIHVGQGERQLGPTTLANVALMNGRYKPVHAPQVFHA